MDREKLKTSIICPNEECYICKTTRDLELHHCLHGSVRKLADEDRLFVALCAFHHRQLHDHGENDRKLQGIAQQAFIANEMTKYPSIDKNAMEEAKKTFYKRYLRFYE